MFRKVCGRGIVIINIFLIFKDIENIIKYCNKGYKKIKR